MLPPFDTALLKHHPTRYQMRNDAARTKRSRRPFLLGIFAFLSGLWTLRAQQA